MTGSPTRSIDDLATLSPQARRRAEVAAVEPYLDRAFYRQHHGRHLADGETPAEHFCRAGWRALLKPSADFDVWWYWANHLDPSATDVNPLVHYAYVGRELGLSTRPEHPLPLRGHDLPRERPVRRACLFAAFDQDGVVDETTIAYVRELARHGDVFVLYDNYVPAEELGKLDGIASKAWAVRHGAYDFGSYSMLARDLVGWDRLMEYDEVLFVNDSCFLLKPLDEVFDEMDGRSCAWWGLQATKGLASTRDHVTNDFQHPIPLEQVKREHLGDYDEDPVYDFLVGSYFLAFRSPVLRDVRFRGLVDAVRPEPSKLMVILKYEIGLTHLLIGRGHDFDTFIPNLPPFHPIFTDVYFSLLEQGFPLLKKYFLSQNHYDEPGLVDWKARVLEHVPTARVEDFEISLVRTAPADALERSFAITPGPGGKVRVPRVLAGASYRRRNARVPKRPDVWVFAVDPVTHRLPESSSAILHAIKDEDEITKVVLTRGRPVRPPASVTTAPLLSERGQGHLLEAGTVFTSRSPRVALSVPIKAKDQVVVAVRDGLTLEKSGRAAAAQSPRPHGDEGGGAPLVHPEAPRIISGVTAASEIDALVAVATHWPATYAAAWRTGIPAHDLLFADSADLPVAIQEQELRLRALLGGRRLLLLAPVVRRTGNGMEPYRFAASELAWLRSWAERTGHAIGVRTPFVDLEQSYLRQMDEFALDLRHARFDSTYAVLRAASAVLTDYAGAALDAAIAGTPVISFAHDLDATRHRLLLDLEHFFPGRIATSFEEVAEALDTLDVPTPHHDVMAGLLVDRTDDANTARLLERVTAELGKIR